MFTRKSTSQLFCSIFRWQCLRLCQHHTSLSQWLQIRCYFLSHKLRHKSQNPFLLSFQYIGGGYQAHNMKVLELNKCLRRTCPQKMRGAGERRASCQLSSGHLCRLYLRTWENRGIPVWTIDELYLNYTSQWKREDICCGICPKPHFLHSPEGSPDLTRVAGIVYRT